MTRLIGRKGGDRQEGVKVLTERVGGDCLVIGGHKLIKLDGKEI